jgi:hypothetical protein
MGISFGNPGLFQRQYSPPTRSPLHGMVRPRPSIFQSVLWGLHAILMARSGNAFWPRDSLQHLSVDESERNGEWARLVDGEERVMRWRGD